MKTILAKCEIDVSAVDGDVRAVGGTVGPNIGDCEEIGTGGLYTRRSLPTALKQLAFPGQLKPMTDIEAHNALRSELSSS